jgi:hypothetical protein
LHTLAPHESHELARIEIRRFTAKKCFQPPSYVRRRPRAQTISFRDDPVIPQGVQHSTNPARPRTGITAPAVIPSAAKDLCSFLGLAVPASECGNSNRCDWNGAAHVNDRMAE